MSVNQEKAIDELAIRDTSDHASTVVFNGSFVIKTLIIENGLDKLVSFQCEGSANSDFSNPFLIGTAWEVTATTNTFQTCDSYIPYWRIVATCSVAPTTGTLTVVVLGVQ